MEEEKERERERERGRREGKNWDFQRREERAERKWASLSALKGLFSSLSLFLPLFGCCCSGGLQLPRETEKKKRRSWMEKRERGNSSVTFGSWQKRRRRCPQLIWKAKICGRKSA